MIKKSEMTDALLRATLTANRSYAKISGDSWLSDAGVESYMVARLADKVIVTLRESYASGKVTIEEPVYSYKHCCCVVRKRGPRKAAMREWGKVDLAFWKDGKGSEHLIGAVEAKRYWNVEQAQKDIKRLRELKNEYGKSCEGQLQYAAFVAFLSTYGDPDGNKMERLTSRIKTWVQDHQSTYGKMQLKFAPRGQRLEIEDEVFRGSAAVIEVC